MKEPGVNAEPIGREKQRLGAAGIGLSLVLLAFKAWAAVRSGSAAVLSDAFNASLDVLTYSLAYVSMRVQERHPDANHPFGHRRAEPLAGLLFAVFAAALGAALVRDGIGHLLQPRAVAADSVSTGLVVTSMVLKGGMALWYRWGALRTQSPALRASFVDSRNDVLASSVALIGLEAGGYVDTAAGVAIGAWIIISGVRVGLENVGYLMGNAPPPHVQAEILAAARSVPGVRGVHDLRAHYVGDRIHVELHIELDLRLSLAEAHAVAVRVRRAVEALELVQEAFIHIDPV
ncbi:MAG TPA: cation diffusion facilitator family transporter [Limnochordales bacterium]